LIRAKALSTLTCDDLAVTPLTTGKGHRNVWRWLRFRDGHRVPCKQVLRLMDKKHLLSPHPGRSNKAAKANDVRFITLASNLRWGSDDTRVFIPDEDHALRFNVFTFCISLPSSW
jgi:hypothetical protein